MTRTNLHIFYAFLFELAVYLPLASFVFDFVLSTDIVAVISLIGANRFIRANSKANLSAD